MLCAELLFGSQMLALIRLSISLHTWSCCYDSAGPGLFEPFRSVDAVVSVVLESLGPKSCKRPAMSNVLYAVHSGPPLLPHQVWKDVLLFGLCVSLANFEDSQT